MQRVNNGARQARNKYSQQKKVQILDVAGDGKSTMLTKY